MKNPFNILNGTILIIVLSVVGLIVLIFFSRSLKFGLVQEDYYEQDLKYQQQIERIERTNALEKSVIISLENDTLLIDFPEIFNFRDISGKIHLFRPSDPELDRFIPLELNESGAQKIDTDELYNGLWKVKLNWTHKELEYYKEKRIFLSSQ